MWKLRILAVCLYFTLSSSTVNARSLAVNQDSSGDAAIQNGFPNVFRPVERLIRRIIGKPRRDSGNFNYYADVTDLTMSRNKIWANCTLDSSLCENNTIIIGTVAVDPENDILTYNYTVSGGKIIGTGSRIIWDLAGEKPGTYTITAGVDDGCGVCGQTQTRTVTVVE